MMTSSLSRIAEGQSFSVRSLLRAIWVSLLSHNDIDTPSKFPKVWRGRFGTLTEEKERTNEYICPPNKQQTTKENKKKSGKESEKFGFLLTFFDEKNVREKFDNVFSFLIYREKENKSVSVAGFLFSTPHLVVFFDLVLVVPNPHVFYRPPTFCVLNSRAKPSNTRTRWPPNQEVSS